MSLTFKVGTVLPSGKVAYVEIHGLRSHDEVPAAISQFLEWVEQLEAKNQNGEGDSHE